MNQYLPIAASESRNASRLDAGGTSRGEVAGGAVAARWAALQDASAAVAALAGLGSETAPPRVRAFPDRIREVGGWRLERAERGVEDLAAIMEYGLAALLAVKASGGDAEAAARSLYREFIGGRAAVLALLPPDESSEIGPGA